MNTYPGKIDHMIERHKAIGQFIDCACHLILFTRPRIAVVELLQDMSFVSNYFCIL